ncbi:MAG: hypothetical protein RQ868_04615 [Meiothermus sp.]|jgi:hypothetical protein|nr:hypothetical protein [Meiothermus sp.]MDT7919854.1 hypothetical protein [Meiothermus sp.]
MRRVMLFLVLLALLLVGLQETAFACKYPDCIPPGVVRSGEASGTGR